MREYQNCHHIFPLDLVGGKHFFRCDDGFHVPKLFVCDDEEDCYDGSDEKDCGEDIFTSFYKISSVIFEATFF